MTAEQMTALFTGVDLSILTDILTYRSWVHSWRLLMTVTT